MINEEQALQVFGGDYEHVVDLAQRGGGIDLQYTALPPAQIFLKMISERCYEACEFSLSNLLILKDRGANWLSAIPVFPYRAFRHSAFHVRHQSTLHHPSDLRGKRVGIPDYSMTAAVWARGILLTQYDVHWSQIEWVASGKQRFGAFEGVPLTYTDGNLQQELAAGTIDALLAPGLLDQHLPAQDRRFRTLIDNVEVVEREYFDRTGVYPINHTVVFRNDTLQRMPDVAKFLFDSYVRAKKLALARRLGTTLIPWGERSWANTMSLFEGDPIPYGLSEKNLQIVTMVGDYLLEQKLISRPPDYEALFATDSLAFRE